MIATKCSSPLSTCCTFPISHIEFTTFHVILLCSVRIKTDDDEKRSMIIHLLDYSEFEMPRFLSMENYKLSSSSLLSSPFE